MYYDYECRECKEIFSDYSTVAERHNSKPCPDCNGASVKLIAVETAVSFGMQYKDVKGTPIWFPKDGKPYFDKALRKTFASAKQKQSYMKEKKICMEGSSNPTKWPEAAGQMRDKSYRKQQRLED